MSTSVLGVSTLSFIRSTSVVPPAMNFAWFALASALSMLGALT